MRRCTWPRVRALEWSLVLALTGACRHDAAGTSAPVEDAAATQDALNDAGGPSFRRPGTAHVAHIDFVSLSRDGAAAISRDTTGGVRLWTALDGTVEPRVVPVRGAVFSSVELHEQGATLFVVDASNGGKLLVVDEQGRLEERASLPPFEPLFEGHVLPGGERVVVLGRDHALRLLDRRGDVLTRFEERRFRPEQLHVSSDGKTIVALIQQPRVAGRFQVEVTRLQLEGDRISRLGSPRLVDAGTEIMRHTSSMSPDGKRFAVVDKVEGSGWTVAIFDLEDPDATPRRQTVELAAQPPPSLGFVSPTQLLLAANDGSSSWLVDLEAGKTYARTAPPQDFAQQGKTQAFGLGRQVAGLGTWLFVHDVLTLEHRFLGYGALRAQTLALSPSAKYVAWGYVQGAVYVEPTDDAAFAATILPGDTSRWATRLRFLDDEHLLVGDTAGGLTLHHWPTQRVVDTEGISGGIRNMEISTDLGLLLVDGATNNQRVWELSTDGFGRTYILSDRAYRSGLFSARASDEPVMWTLDGGNRLRSYRLEDLRGDLSREVSGDRGKVLPGSEPVPLAIDTQGRHYGVRWNGQRMELYVREVDGVRGEATQARTGALSGDSVTQIVPSPSGDRFVAVTGSGPNVAVRAYDAQTLEEVWSFSTGVHNSDLVWSPDGRFVGVAAMTGAVVLDAASGAPVRRRCGLDFQVSAAPPTNPFGVLDRPSLCE